MRILHIDKFLHRSAAAGGGVGRYVHTLADELRRRGHEVEFFGCAGQTGPLDRPKYIDFREIRNPAGVFRLLHNADAAAMLERFLRRHPVDVAHLHNVYHHLTASILPVLARHGVGVVMTVHDYRQIGLERLFWRWNFGDPNDDAFLTEARKRCAGFRGSALRLRWFVERATRWYFRWVDAFLCPTRFLAERLRRAGGPRDKIIYAPVPLVLKGDAPIASPADGKTLLFVGRLQREKSPELMLDLAARLPQTQIALAGDGPLRTELDERCQREGIKNVTLLGQVSRESLSAWYARAAAVVVPSRCMENSPVAMLEAMSAQRCVLVPDQPALREWITDAQTGRLYATGNADDLARVAGEVLADPTRREDMGRRARELVYERHDLQNTMDRIERQYERAQRRCALR